MTTQQNDALQCAADLEYSIARHGMQDAFTLNAYRAMKMVLTQHTRITELESQLAQRFDAADMATASAQGFRGGAASVDVAQERPTPEHIEAMQRAWLWMENQAEAQSKGGHATFDLMMLRDERDALRAALAAGQATAARQPHRSGCTAGSDEECVQRGCGTNCPAVSPRADSPPAPVLDERDDFEKVFPLPSGCVRVGAGYAATGYSNWAAHTHCERWQGWQARAARDPADSAQQEDAARYRYLRDGDWREHEKLESVIRLQLNALWDETIDTARKQGEKQ